MLGLEPVQNPAWDSNPWGLSSNPAKTQLSLPTEITDLALGPNDALVLHVSSLKKLSERQSGS